MHHELYMQRCLDLAQMAIGYVSPNPLVGCVIMEDGEIIGEGWHMKYGGPHAEVNAVNSVLSTYGDAEGGARLRKSTVYVNLEPCAHFGKTPPCADLLVRHQVKEVIVGSLDPFPAVNGQGVEKLRAAGIRVQTGIMQTACDHVNRRFLTRVKHQRPYVILKWAQTENNFFAPADGTKRWITGQEARILVHKWRSEEDAVLVGKNTSMADDPELTVRFWAGRNPVRAVIDRLIQTPPTARVFNKEAPTIILNEVKSVSRSRQLFLW